jgi:hypothetical protein
MVSPAGWEEEPHQTAKIRWRKNKKGRRKKSFKAKLSKNTQPEEYPLSNRHNHTTFIPPLTMCGIWRICHAPVSTNSRLG